MILTQTLTGNLLALPIKISYAIQVKQAVFIFNYITSDKSVGVFVTYPLYGNLILR